MIEQRKAKRFDLKLPLELVRSGSQSASKAGETRNLSTMGVLFTSDARVSLGETVEYLITLLTAPDAGHVRIRCLGKVVRSVGPDVAATLERYEFVRQGETHI